MQYFHQQCFCVLFVSFRHSKTIFSFVQPCGTGDLDGGSERAQNFMDIVDEMKCFFVEVVPGAATPAQDNGKLN
jgi:hypothetical protein